MYVPEGGVLKLGEAEEAEEEINTDQTVGRRGCILQNKSSRTSSDNHENEPHERVDTEMQT